MGGHAFQARRPLDLEALTARLKPCPSTTAPIPRVFFRNLWSRALPRQRSNRVVPQPVKSRVDV